MWQYPQFPADLVTFAEEIFNGKLRFSCSVNLKWMVAGQMAFLEGTVCMPLYEFLRQINTVILKLLLMVQGVDKDKG